MIELLIILALAAYIAWLRFTHRRQVDALLEHAAGLQAQIEAKKDYAA